MKYGKFEGNLAAPAISNYRDLTQFGMKAKFQTYPKLTDLDI